ncbi:hypothetical protein PG994_014538 [Apiospora phragmitis]|uniref:Uncharacterized protein n=1 Tax=Apiospora phragmitis TaxID=2905665 RepID=A0ABR1T4K5_9PEZI
MHLLRHLLSLAAIGGAASFWKVPHDYIAPPSTTQGRLHARDSVSTTITAEPVDPSPDPSPTSVSQPAFHHAPLTQRENTRDYLLSSLGQARTRGRAELCRNIQPQLFFNKAKTFLRPWKTDDDLRTKVPDERILARLVAYQVVQDTVETEREQHHKAFPGDMLDYARSTGELIRKDGVLTGANPGVLRALDTIFDDICGGTGKVQIPAGVRETVDGVLRGLAVDPQPAPPPGTATAGF